MTRVFVKYKLTYDDILHAFQYRSSAMGKKKRMIQSGAFLVLAVVFLVSYLMSREYTMGLVLGLLCLGMTGVIWEMPFFSLKRIARSIEKQDAQYTVDFQEEGLLLGCNNEMVTVPYSDPALKIHEDEDSYIIFAPKNRLFSLPKRRVTRELREQLSLDLPGQLGERYRRVEQKKTGGGPKIRTGKPKPTRERDQ